MTLQDYFLTHIDLQKEWNCDRNTISPASISLNTPEKIWWRCKRNHEWQATLNSRIYSKRGCPYCVNQAVLPGENDLATLTPWMVELWHPTLNGNLTPQDLPPGSRRMVWWQCPRGHSWKTPPYSLKAGCSCPYCSGKRAIPGETDLVTTHPHILKLWNPKNSISPREISAGSSRIVLWVCENGHEWEARVHTITKEACGCPYCSGKRAIPGETDLATLRPDLMEQWDSEKNTINPSAITISSHNKVWWKCALGHSWQSVVFSRTKENGTDCPYCTGRLVLKGFNDLATLKPQLAEQWYQPLNGNLMPDQVTLGSNKKVWWQCSDGHVWQAFVYARTKAKGTGCPVCAGVTKPRRSNPAPSSPCAGTAKRSRRGNT